MPLQPGQAAPPGFIRTQAGLLISADTMAKSLQSEQAFYKARQKAMREAQRGTFFSDWTRLTGFNQAGAMEKPEDAVGFSFLRDTYSHSAIDQLIINTRIQQFRQVSQRCRDPQQHAGYRVVHKDHDKPDFIETDELRRLCEHIEDIIASPTKDIHPNGVKDVFTIAVREELTIDRKTAVIYRDRMGRPYRYHLVDGATVLPVVAILYPWLLGNASRFGISFDDRDPNSLSEALNRAGDEIAEITGIPRDALAYVQEINGEIKGGWTVDQISLDITQSSVWMNKLPYGQGSLLEQSIELTAAWVNAWQYNQNLFRTNYPERLVAIKGDYDPNALEAMKRKIFSEAGPASWERLLIMPGDEDFDVKTFNLRDTPKDMMYGELLRIIVLLKTAVYRMDPSTIGFSHDTGSGSSLFAGGSREQQLAAAEEEGFHGLLQNTANWFTETIVKPWHEDLIMIFDGLKREQEKERIELSSQAVDKYWRINEALAKENKPKLKPINGVDVGDYPLPLALAALQAASQSAAQAPQMAPDDPKERAGTEAPKKPKSSPRGQPEARVRKSRSLLVEVLED